MREAFTITLVTAFDSLCDPVLEAARAQISIRYALLSIMVCRIDHLADRADDGVHRLWC